MRETLQAMVARINASAYIPLPPPHGGKRKKGVTMAREFKLPKGAKLTKAVGGGTAKYPWGEWFAGKLLLIERSTINGDGTIGEKRDYDVPAIAMVAKVKVAARRKYKVVDVYRRDHNNAHLDNDGLLIQARDMTPEERGHEDTIRAKEQKAAKARRVHLLVESAPAVPAVPAALSQRQA